MPRPSSADSTRRLIALLGHLTPELSVSVEDLAETLGTSTARLADDLSVLSLCGVTPYSPDQMVDVFVEDGMVEVYSPLPAVDAPVRLSPAEARALATALAAAGFTADDPLTTRLLAASSANFDAEELERTLRSATATHESKTFETLASAIHERAVVNISYQNDGMPAPTFRTVESQQLFAERGAWYLSAWCRTANAMRTFRIDRIRDANATGGHFTGRPTSDSETGTLSAFAPEGLPVATLRFATGEPFVEREWPGGRMACTEPDGSIIAEVPFAGTAWLGRRVVARLGSVEVLGPPGARTVVAEIAAGMLASS